MAETSFIEKLRMNNIFPPGGAGSTNTPFGMPTMNTGLDIPSLMASAQSNAMQENERERQFEREMFDRKANLQNIAARVADKPVEKGPMNTIYQPNVTDFQRASLGLKERELGQKGSIAETRAGLTQQDVDTRRRRAELAEKIADGKATDEEKHEYRMTEIGQRGDITSRQIGERGDITSKQIGEKQTGQENLQKMRGAQGLESIAARGRTALATQAAKPIKEELPSQTKVRQTNAARELMNTRPDLAKFITVDDKGNVTVAQPTEEKSFMGYKFGGGGGPTPEQQKEIEQIFYGTKPAALEPKKGSIPSTVKKVKVTKGGKSYMLPEDQVADATKQGYTVVK